MTWQGTPFPFDHANDILSFVIEKMPNIEISTGFAWDSVISSFIAGAIPALIAWKAIRSNYQLTELQAKQMQKKELADKLRMAALDYICSVENLGFKSYLLVNDKTVAKSDLEKGIFPEHYMAALNKVQRDERYLCLLIEPTPKGMSLLEKLPDFQSDFKSFFIHDASIGDGFDRLKKSADDFIFEFHKYMSEY